jgi:predicted nuclease of restriction endonuclease-like (RecB) superfamily
MQNPFAMKKPKPATTALFDRVQTILDSARSHAARSVNTTQVVANWLIGREIVEEQQSGAKRAGYGQDVIAGLAGHLKSKRAAGYGELTLKLCRQFYLAYPELPGLEICYALRNKSGEEAPSDPIIYALRKQSPSKKKPSKTAKPPERQFADTLVLVPQVIESARSAEWQPGLLHPSLSWTHYRTLMRVPGDQARAFYEIEAIQQDWTARELERQINSLLFERLAKSRDKKGVMKLATKGQQIQTPADVFKDPVVIEFLGLPESHRLVESKVEEALISHLKDFLLELGKGFAFVARQERLTLEGDHFYVDLVFYHTILKCYVLIDIKVQKLSHQDIGQMQLYTNYYDQERLTPGDNPTLGLILCTDQNETAVRYTLGPGQQKIFSSRYQFHLPSEADLAAQIRRELDELTPAKPKPAPRKKR